MFFIFLAIIAVLISIMISSYNNFIQIKNSVDESFSTIDVYLKKRYDLLPNLVNTVKGYAKHEKETLENVIKARNTYLNSTSIDAKISNENMISGALSKLFALKESYPELKANENFINLQNQIMKIEEDLVQARKYYNGSVKIFNTKCDTFPSLIIAKIMNFAKYSYFEINNQIERENIKVEF